jgi:hypothetical protein
MKIDKSRFLLLTTSLAATATALAVATVACNSTSTSTDNDSGPPTTTPEAGGGGDGGKTDGGGEQCLGTDGTAPMCSPTGEGGGDEDAGADDAGDGGTAATVAKCQFECQTASSTFKTGVAVAINACLDKAVADPTVEGACAGALPGCATEAIGKACDDDTAAAFCTENLAQCGGGGDDAGTDGGGASGITQDKCVAVAKALSGEGRTSLSTCISEGNSCEGCFATASGQPLP